MWHAERLRDRVVDWVGGRSRSGACVGWFLVALEYPHDTTKSSAKRAVTSVAPQALTLFNGRFVNEQAAHFARQLEKEAGGDPSRQIERAYRLALSRAPTAAETDAMVEFLATEAERARRESSGTSQPVDGPSTKRRALEQLCRVILNLNEFVYPD